MITHLTQIDESGTAFIDQVDPARFRYNEHLVLTASLDGVLADNNGVTFERKDFDPPVGMITRHGGSGRQPGVGGSLPVSSVEILSDRHFRVFRLQVDTRLPAGQYGIVLSLFCKPQFQRYPFRRLVLKTKDPIITVT